MSCLGCGRAELLVCETCLLQALKPRVRRPLKVPLRAIYGAFDYHDKLTRTLVARFKYHGVTELAEVFGRVLSVIISDKIRDSAVFIVPIPSDLWRRLERGYNQTELLARSLNRLTGWPVMRSLKKRYPTPSQTELKKKERKKNLRGSLHWRGDSLQGTTVVLVDDVTTTGSTLTEAARVLRAARPNAIYGLVLAFD